MESNGHNSKTLEDRLKHYEKTGEIDQCPEIQVTLDELIENERQRVTQEQEVQERLRKKQLEQEQQKLNEQESFKLKQQLQEIELARQTIQESSSLLSQDLNHSNESFEGSFLPIAKSCQVLLTHFGSKKSELPAQQIHFEHSIYYITQGLEYSQRYLAHHLQPHKFQQEIQKVQLPNQYIRRILRYLGNLSSFADEIALRLQDVLHNEIDQLDASPSNHSENS
jgi:hypothetical protein